MKIEQEMPVLVTRSYAPYGASESKHIRKTPTVRKMSVSPHMGADILKQYRTYAIKRQERFRPNQGRVY